MLSAAGALLGYGAGPGRRGDHPRAVPGVAGVAARLGGAGGAGTALVTGLVFGVLPARRAAALDPVLALAKR